MKDITIKELEAFCYRTGQVAQILPSGAVMVRDLHSERFHQHTMDWLEEQVAQFCRPSLPRVADLQPTAMAILEAAGKHMEDRAATYDQPAGERSMGRTVQAFNALTGMSLTEEQGWLFMEVLKAARSQQGGHRADNYEDAVAYAALRGECAARERKVANDNATRPAFLEPRSVRSGR